MMPHVDGFFVKFCAWIGLAARLKGVRVSGERSWSGLYSFGV